MVISLGRCCEANTTDIQSGASELFAILSSSECAIAIQPQHSRDRSAEKCIYAFAEKEKQRRKMESGAAGAEGDEAEKQDEERKKAARKAREMCIDS